MPDLYHTINELNILFQAMILQILGYEKVGSPADYTEEAYSKVRVSWQTYGAPAWKITDDVAFIQTSEEDEPINRQREVDYTESLLGPEPLDEEVSYTRVLNLAIIFYGPNSFHNAQVVRDGIFREVYRRPLSQNNIYLIPDVAAPRRVPEQFQSQWWERVDLELRFNEKIVKSKDIGIIEIADIVVVSDTGQEREIEVISE